MIWFPILSKLYLAHSFGQNRICLNKYMQALFSLRAGVFFLAISIEKQNKQTNKRVVLTISK